MTKSFEQLLYFFGASSMGKDIAVDDEVNIEEIRKYAVEQGIWTVIFNNLKRVCDVSKYKNEFLATVVNSMRKTEFNSYIMDKIDGCGIEYCLLKGDTIARFYHNPQYRISGDTDILINPKYEKKIAEILSQNGYSVEKRKAKDHHLKAYHPVGGLLEIHVNLYSAMTEKVIFDGMKLYNEPYQEICIGGKYYKTLGINDGLMYLTAHYIKHLINSGGGIRQMMDLLLYIDYYKKEIDFNRYYSILKDLKYDKLIKVIMSIGGKYFGFDYEVVDEELMLEMLDDTEKGGIFGFSSDDRLGFYNSYCKSRTKWSALRYNLFYLFNVEGLIIKVFFPSRNNMKRLGYDDKFLPIAWLRRIVGIIVGKRGKKVEDKKSGIKNRMELMRKLEMIE